MPEPFVGSQKKVCIITPITITPIYFVVCSVFENVSIRPCVKGYAARSVLENFLDDIEEIVPLIAETMKQELQA